MSATTTITCAGCSGVVRSAGLTSAFDDRRFVVDCVPPTHVLQA